MRTLSPADFDLQQEHRLKLVKMYASITAKNSECTSLIASMIKHAATSVRMAMYCLASDEVIAALIGACTRLKEVGKVVLVLDDNEHNAKAIQTLAPVFRSTGNLLRVWHQPEKKSLYHACHEQALRQRPDNPVAAHQSKC